MPTFRFTECTWWGFDVVGAPIETIEAADFEEVKFKLARLAHERATRFHLLLSDQED